MSDTRDVLKLFLWQAERHADILATILTRMSARTSVSASWNAGLTSGVRAELTVVLLVAGDARLDRVGVVASDVMRRPSAGDGDRRRAGSAQAGGVVGS